MNLVDVLDAAAADPDSGLDAIERQATGSTVQWVAAGQPFARTDGPTAEFRLKPVVARAALGTPDTRPSSQGPDWIAFRPPELDRFAVDRAAAWFVSAARAARGRDRPGATRP